VKRAGILTYLTIAILVLFGIVDATAELTGDGKGKYGETFSTFIAHLDRKAWYYRVAVAIIMLVLASHLTFQTPLIPGVV
jgi:hypothetical protein